jgi:hypothetical protein
MVEWRENDERVDIRYGDGVTVKIHKQTEQLTVQWGRLTIADNEDRFIPIGNLIYMYSRNGTERDWMLPDDWMGAEITAFRLIKDGDREAVSYTLGELSIRLRLDPHIPVILEKTVQE